MIFEITSKEKVIQLSTIFENLIESQVGSSIKDLIYEIVFSIERPYTDYIENIILILNFDCPASSSVKQGANISKLHDIIINS